LSSGSVSLPSCCSVTVTVSWLTVLWTATASVTISSELFLSVIVSSELFQILVSHSLKRVPCRLGIEHLIEGLNLSIPENASDMQETSLYVVVGITVCLCRYNGNASVRCLGNDASELSLLFRLSGIPRQWHRNVFTEPLSSNGHMFIWTFWITKT
jgi:hypothetical protein